MIIHNKAFPRSHIQKECFYNKEGKWYYAGVYKTFRLRDITPEEWAKLKPQVRGDTSKAWTAFFTEIADNTSVNQRHAKPEKKLVTSKHIRDRSAVRCGSS